MKIGIYLESLARVLTTGTPYRGMLRELLQLRPQDHFELYVHQESTREPLIEGLLESLPTDNWRLVPLARTRKSTNIKALLGFHRYSTIDSDIDILLSSDFDYHNFQRGPQIAHLHDLVAVDLPQYCSMPWHGRWIRKQQLKMLGNSSVHICTISDFSRERLVTQDSRFSNRVTVIPNGIDPIWHERDNPKVSSRLLEGIPSKYWIWWGQITRRKNVRGILAAYANLLNDPSLTGEVPHLLFVGKIGADSSDILKVIEKLNLESRVRIIPFQSLETLVDVVSLSEGLVFPSFYEGFGLPVVEAMSRGIPVVASSVSSMPEVAGGNAILVDPDEIASVTQGLKILYESNSIQNDSHQTRKSWASQFTFARAASKYSTIIDQLVTSS